MSKYTSMMKDASHIRGMMSHANVQRTKHKVAWLQCTQHTLGAQSSVCVSFVSSSPVFSSLLTPPWMSVSVCSLLSVGVWQCDNLCLCVADPVMCCKTCLPACMCVRVCVGAYMSVHSDVGMLLVLVSYQTHGAMQMLLQSSRMWGIRYQQCETFTFSTARTDTVMLAQPTWETEEDATPVSQIYQFADTAVLSHMELVQL